MIRLLGVGVVVAVLYGTLMAAGPEARSLQNQVDMLKRLGFYGILTLGAGLLILSGGIDLSMGSVVGLSAVSLAVLLERGVPAPLAALLVLLLASSIGLFHGLLVTQLHLQPFLVTLCGLFIYRGAARWITTTDAGSSRSVGLAGVDSSALEFMDSSTFLGVPKFLLLLAILATVLAILLHGSVHGRYLYAIGANEQAARYAGISTERYKILAYVICSFMAGLGGLMYMLENRTAAPSAAGQFYELYAITGAVLGGCSLRGGEGSIPGMILGAAVLPLLAKLVIFYDYPDDVEPTIIGVALLVGTIADQLLKGRSR